MTLKERGFAHLLPVLLIAAAIILGVILVTHPTLFQPKADLNASAIEFSGTGVSSDKATTSTPDITLTLHYVSTPAPSPITTAMQLGNSNDGYQPQAPYYATFYYPWYGNSAIDHNWNHWGDQSRTPPSSWFAHMKPEIGLYSSHDDNALYYQLQKMAYAHINVAISSWWGQGSYEDNAFRHIITDVMNRPENPYPHLKWAIYYELEGPGFSPTVSSITSDINYILSNYANQPSYLKIGGKPVIFVYADPDDGADMVQRWAQVRAATNTYIVLKVFNGYQSYAGQVDSWHQYAPANRVDNQSPYAVSVSPGFFFANDSSPRLARDPSAFSGAVSTLVSSNATWKLITTWNEWGEGTGVEPAELGSQFLDILHSQLPAVNVGVSSTTNIPQELEAIQYIWNSREDIKNYFQTNESSSADPIASIRTWAGLWHPSEFTAQGSDYIKYAQSLGFGQETFPTSFKVANSQAELANAAEQTFDANDKQVSWSLPSGNGAKTIFAQFKVGGVWMTPISDSITLATPGPAITFSSSSTDITLGQSYTLNWSTTNATSCTVSTTGPENLLSGNRETHGSITMTPHRAGTYTHTLQCSGNSQTATQSVAITVSAPASSSSSSSASSDSSSSSSSSSSSASSSSSSASSSSESSSNSSSASSSSSSSSSLASSSSSSSVSSSSSSSISSSSSPSNASSISSASSSFSPPIPPSSSNPNSDNSKLAYNPATVGQDEGKPASSLPVIPPQPLYIPQPPTTTQLSNGGLTFVQQKSSTSTTTGQNTFSFSSSPVSTPQSAYDAIRQRTNPFAFLRNQPNSPSPTLSSSPSSPSILKTVTGFLSRITNQFGGLFKPNSQSVPQYKAPY